MRRHPAGVSTGGQFAPSARHESGATLTAAAERTADEALRLAAQEVLDVHPSARALLLQEDTSGPVPAMVAYQALVGDGDLVWLDPDLTDAVHGHLGALNGLDHAMESAAMAGAPLGADGAWLPLRQAVTSTAA